MIKLKSKRLKNVVGVDVGSGAVKVVELSGDSLKNVRIESYAIVPFSTEFSADQFPHEKATEAIKSALKTAGIKERTAAMSMPTQGVITKRSSVMSGLGEVEMEEQVAIDAEQFVPFKSEEISVDYYVEGEREDSDGELSVVITAAKKTDIEDRVALAEGAGMNVSIMDVEFHALKSAASFCADEDVLSKGTVMIVDAGGNSMQIGVLHKGDQVYFRKQEFSGQQTIASDMRSAYGFDPLEAENKRIKDDLPEDYATRIEEPFARSLAVEIARAIQFFVSSTQYSTIDLIILAGGSSTVAGLPKFVNEQSGIKTIPMNPFIGLGRAKKVKEAILEKDAPSLALAFGLALRRFDQ